MAHFQNNAVPEAPETLFLCSASYNGYSSKDSQPVNPDWATNVCALARIGMNTKPKRQLSGDELALLESEFQKNKKPNSNLKQGLAGRLGVDIARINNWFQNRRAKQKQIIKAAEMEKNRKAENIKSESPSPEEELPPLSELNDLLHPSMVTLSTLNNMGPPQTEPDTVSVNLPTEVMETRTPSEALHSELASQSSNGSPPHTDNNVDFTQVSDPSSQCKFTGLTWTQPLGMSNLATAEIAASTVPFFCCASAGNGDFPPISSNALHQEGLNKFPPNIEAQAEQDVPQLSIPFPQGFQFESSLAADLASRRRPTSPVLPGMDRENWLLSVASGYELQDVLWMSAAPWRTLAENNYKEGTSLLPSPGPFVDLNPRVPLAILSPNPLEMYQYPHLGFAISDEQALAGTANIRDVVL